MQAQHAQLMSLASRDALNRDFVTRPEFRLTVQEEHYRKLQDHTKRLADLEQKVQDQEEELDDQAGQIQVLQQVCAQRSKLNLV